MSRLELPRTGHSVDVRGYAAKDNSNQCEEEGKYRLHPLVRRKCGWGGRRRL